MDTIIIDIDGTICPIKKENESYKDLVPYKDMVDKIRELKSKGYRIVLYTSRNMRTYNGNIDLIHKNTKPIVDLWLKKWNIPADEVIYGKPWPGHKGFYVDDRAIRPRELLEMTDSDINKLFIKDRLDEKYEYIFKINDVCIKVKSDNKKIIDDLIFKYGSYYETSNEYDFEINYIVNSKNKYGFEYKESIQKEQNYLYKNDNSLDVYMNEYTNLDEDFAKRIFTTTVIKVLQEHDYTILHAACVAQGNDAFIISGDKRSGKTTTVLNLLKKGYDYIANDRIAVKEINGEVVVVGIPFSMGIMLKDADSLFDISDLKQANDGLERKVYIENHNIESTFNVNVKSKAIVKSILLPKINDSLDSINVNRVDDTVSYLGNNIMIYNAIPEEKKFLNYMFKPVNKDNSFINNIDSYIIEQNKNTYDDLDIFIKEELLGRRIYVLRFTCSH